MTIQFNKVTWYSKLAALVVLIVTIFLGWYIYAQYKEVSLMNESISSPPSSNGAVTTSGEVALTVGGFATFDGLQITFDKIIQDSRCPVDVMCIQAGTVTAQVTLRSGGKVQQANLVSDKVLYRFANYAIYLLHAAPAPHSKVEIDPNNYTIVFHVTNVLGT
jgi:hypothetical protein